MYPAEDYNREDRSLYLILNMFEKIKHDEMWQYQVL